MQKNDGCQGQHAKKRDSCDAEAIEWPALLRGEEYYKDGDGNEKNYKMDHGKRALHGRVQRKDAEMWFIFTETVLKPTNHWSIEQSCSHESAHTAAR